MSINIFSEAILSKLRGVKVFTQAYFTKSEITAQTLHSLDKVRFCERHNQYQMQKSEHENAASFLVNLSLVINNIFYSC